MVFGSFWRANLAALGVVLALAAVPARAAVLVHLNFEEMAEKSSAILVGRCVEVRSEPDAEFRIVTHNVFEVSEYLKGSLGRRVTITEPGGRIGDQVTFFSGMPQFRVGEEAVLFVWTSPQGQRHQVIGFTQGKFEMSRNATSGEVSLRQTASNEPMLEPKSHAGETAEPAVVPMTAFRTRVSAALARAAAQSSKGSNGRAR